jgi:hypothetical protein
MTSIAEWPLAAVTVRLDQAGERGPLEIPTTQIIDLVTAAINTADEGSTGQLVTRDYFDREDAVMLGQVSSYAPSQCIIVPFDDPRPFFILNNSYSAVRVLSHTWTSNRQMKVFTNKDVINATKEFAARLKHAYEQSLAPSKRS